MGTSKSPLIRFPAAMPTPDLYRSRLSVLLRKVAESLAALLFGAEEVRDRLSDGSRNRDLDVLDAAVVPTDVGSAETFSDAFGWRRSILDAALLSLA
jgi:hypothetical protein